MDEGSRLRSTHIFQGRLLQLTVPLGEILGCASSQMEKVRYVGFANCEKSFLLHVYSFYRVIIQSLFICMVRLQC